MRAGWGRTAKCVAARRAPEAPVGAAKKEQPPEHRSRATAWECAGNLERGGAGRCGRGLEGSELLLPPVDSRQPRLPTPGLATPGSHLWAWFGFRRAALPTAYVG